MAEHGHDPQGFDHWVSEGNMPPNIPQTTSGENDQRRLFEPDEETDEPLDVWADYDDSPEYENLLAHINSLDDKEYQGARKLVLSEIRSHLRQDFAIYEGKTVSRFAKAGIREDNAGFLVYKTLESVRRAVRGNVEGSEKYRNPKTRDYRALKAATDQAGRFVAKSHEEVPEFKADVVHMEGLLDANRFKLGQKIRKQLVAEAASDISLAVNTLRRFATLVDEHSTDESITSGDLTRRVLKTAFENGDHDTIIELMKHAKTNARRSYKTWEAIEQGAVEYTKSYPLGKKPEGYPEE